MKIAFLPGWGLMLALALLSSWLSSLVAVAGKHPLEASALAVIIGVILANSTKLPGYFYPGIKAGEKPLALGIVLMGAGLNLATLASQGAALLYTIIFTMIVGLFGVLLIARYFRISSALSLLLSVGTCICGGTAVAIIAPLIKAKDDETAYAVATIALWGIVAILLYPVIGEAFAVSDFEFGVFAGTAIHSTPQVVGAGYSFSDAAGNTATAVKLVRNCFIAPIALLIALWYAKKDRAQGAQAPSWSALARAFPWFLFGYFILSAFSTLGYFSAEQVDYLNQAGKFLIIVGMAAVGLNTNLAAIKAAGAKPLIVGLLGALLVAGFSVLSIVLFL